MAAAILDLYWGTGENNWYHVLAAPGGWFCGLAAFVASRDGVTRLGKEMPRS